MHIREPNGAGYMRHKGVAAYHVVSKCDDWYQAKDAVLAAQIIRDRLPPTKIIAFGASMGAFGALCHSEIYKPNIMIVGCPQVVIDNSISLGRDERWRPEWSALEITQPVARPWRESLIYVAYDPYVPEDSWHLSKLDASAIPIKLPYSGHEVFGCLTEAGLWIDYMDACARNDVQGVELVRRHHLAKRRGRPEYSEVLQSRWPEYAARARLERVRSLYQTYFDRLPEPREEQYWMGMGRARRLADLRNTLVSEPWSDEPIARALAALYLRHFNRTIRTDELQHWSDAVKRGASLEHVQNILSRESIFQA